MKTKISGTLVRHTITKGFDYFLSLVCLLVFSLSVQAQGIESRLWITDDVTRMVYEVTLEGRLLSSFPVEISVNGSNPFSISPSEIDTDGQNGTLWVVSENPGRIVNFSTTGEQLMEPILTESFGAFGPEGVSFAVDDFTGTLLVVSDPNPDTGILPEVFEIETDGTVINQFQTAMYDPASTSPQGITVDPADGTLWIVDNSSDNIYHIERDGTLIQTLVLEDGLFENPQGITVSKSNGTLWVTDRYSNSIYNLDRTTGEVIFSFPTSHYDVNSENATGIAYQSGVLDIAEKVSALAFDKAKFILEKGAVVNGDVGIAGNAKASCIKSDITGSLFINSEAKKSNWGDHNWRKHNRRYHNWRNHKRGCNNLRNHVVIGEGIVKIDLSQLVANVKQVSEIASNLTATQTFGKIDDSITIYGNPGLNVIKIHEINLNYYETLNLECTAECEFVLNVTHKVKVANGSAIELQGGLMSKHVLFNLGNRGLRVKNNSIARGIFLVLAGKAKIERNSQLEGAVFAGKELKISNSELIGIQ